jgi:hypothetical protein
MMRFFFLIPFILFLGCLQEPVTTMEPDPDELKEYAIMEVTVVSCNLSADPYCDDPEPIQGAVVQVFASEEDREYEEPILFQATTSATGKVQFSLLDVGTRYYLRTSSSKGIKETEDTTPARGIAYHEVLYLN